MALEDQIDRGEITLRWRTVGDSRVCQDCDPRHDSGGLTLDEWEAQGLPGTGWSICRGLCRCILLPESLLGIDEEVLEPFQVDVALADVEEPGMTPGEAARIAANTRLIDEFRPGTRVRYRGDSQQFVGQTAIVKGNPTPDPAGGLVISFEQFDPRFPEFGELRVYDFTDIIAVVE